MGKSSSFSFSSKSTKDTLCTFINSEIIKTDSTNHSRNMRVVAIVPVLVLAAVSAVEAFSSSSTTAFVSSKTSSPLNQLYQAASVIDEATGLIPVESAVEEKQQQISYLDDGFVFGMEGSGLERPKGKQALVVVEGDDLETKDWQVAVVSATFLGHALFASSAIHEMLQVNGGDVATTAAQALSLVAASWVLADFGSGVLHWSVDNYGNGRTPIMGNIIAAFQGHHTAPWTITQRGFSNNVYKLCVPFGVATMGAISYLTGPHATLFFSIFCALEILSQEFHKWSHMTKKEVPEWVNWLQDAGITIGRKPHAQHHMAPYDGNYCIISGVCNQYLDESGFFRRLEHIVYNLNGVESNAWKLDPELKERTLRGEYEIPQTN